MTDETHLDSYHVILVEPAESLNIGSVARAMMNLEFRHLHLVAPRGYDRARANITACWAQPILDAAVFHERFEDALAGMEDVVGVSGVQGRDPSRFITLPEWVQSLPARNTTVARTALVFGPEDNGLRREHLDQCRWTVSIPSSSSNPSFNLAQAVLLVLYEIARALPDTANTVPESERDLPTWNEYFQLDRLVESVMIESRFLRDGTPEHVPGTVRNLLRRIPLDRHEMAILLGLFGKINTALRRSHRAEPDGETK